VYTSREETIKSFDAIVSGQADDTPEQAFMYVAKLDAVILANYDIFAEAGKNQAVGHEVILHPDSGGKIRLTFVSVKDNAKVSGIEIALLS